MFRKEKTIPPYTSLQQTLSSEHLPKMFRGKGASKKKQQRFLGFLKRQFAIDNRTFSLYFCTVNLQDDTRVH